MMRITALCLAFIGLTACAETTAAVMVGASVISVIETEKTIPDHAISYVTGRDCSLVAASEGRDYCVPGDGETDDETAAGLQGGQPEPRHCYRTLGNITCYSEPDRLASDMVRMQ